MSAAQLQPSSSSRDPFARFLEWHRKLPRAGRWGATSFALLAVFYAFELGFWPAADALNENADRWSSVLSRAAERAKGLPSEITMSAIVHGPNSAPVLEVDGKRRLSAAIDAILRKKGVKNYGSDIRPAQTLPATVLPEIAAMLAGSMGRTVADLRFEAAPDDVTAIIADFDADPDVDCITDLKLTYNTANKRVGVQMVVEKWGVVRKTPPRGSA